MAGRICRLSPELASQIAAGEVIERPVSVVKELLENALDANATKIDILILDSGFRSIKIEDNGDGIDEQDLVLALEPHCTSKLHILEDLYEIQSKGFRGEALASMASVAKIDMCSRPKHQQHAMRIISEQGQNQLTPAVRDFGTSIEVKELFYNVPVRKKFLKSHSFEWSAIETLVKRFAMSAPQVHFILRHDQEIILELPIAHSPQEHLARIKKIWGKSFDDAISIDVDRSGLRLCGWIGDLQNHRSQNDRLWVFLNQRIVQDKLILHALKQVYLPLLPPGRHPQCVLYLETPPGMVDINVHPAKQEVRFEQPRLIYDFILSSLKNYWQAHPIGMSTASNEKLITTTEATNSAFECMPFSSSWTICNAEYILLSHVPHQYLVHVESWWQQHIQKQLKPQQLLESRQLMMPYIHHLPKFNEKFLLSVFDKLKLYGLDMQIWGDNSICIRAIPAWLPQFNLKSFGNILNQASKLEDINVKDLIQCCQFSAYDITHIEYQLMLEDIGQSNLFTRPLDIEACRKIFK
jgi:DNA mismatch repair protein MutL